MIKHLLYKNIKDNKILVISFIAILLLYGTIAIGMYNPEDMSAMEAMFGLLPDAMVNMMGFNLIGPLVNYISNYLFGFIMIMFPMIFLIMLGNKLVAKQVSSGSMTYLLTTPYTRKKIITSQALFYILSLFVIMLIPYLVIISMSALMFPELLDYGKYSLLTLSTFSILALLSSIIFFFSVLFDDTSKTLGYSSAVGIGMFVISMVAKLGEEVEFLKYFSFFSFINVNHIIDTPMYGWMVVLIGIISSTIIYYLSIILFDKKSLIL